MSEDLGGRPPIPTAESGEVSRNLRDLAVDYAGYFGVYVAGRGEYDRASDRVGPLEGIVERFPAQADRIKLLDAHLERAYELKKGFFTRLTPNEDIDPKEVEESARKVFDAAHPHQGIWQSRDLLNGLHRLATSPRRGASSGTPPDYTFSSVRHPVARPLLDLLNIAMAVDDNVVERPEHRARVLILNGDSMVRELVGKDRDPKKLLRITDVAVLEAVFDGRLKLPASPGKPLYPDQDIRVGSGELPEKIA